MRQVPAQFRKNRSDRSDLADLTDQQRWALYAPWLENADPGIRANAVICLTHQTNYLLDQQIAALEQQFVEGGGYSERLAVARIAERQRQRHTAGPEAKAPDCPLCGKPLVLRTASKGTRAGSPFWGCSGYPECKGTLALDAAGRSAGSDRSDR